MNLDRRHFLHGIAASGLTSMTGVASAQTPPAVLRFGVAQPAIGNPPGFYGSSVSIAHAKGWIEEEFKKDNIKIEWFFFKGAGPAVNEALTNKQLDFAFQGDLPAPITGR